MNNSSIKEYLTRALFIFQTPKKYILKKGEYGYYIEEYINEIKKTNYNLKFLINKISENNKLNINNDMEKILSLITIKDIKDNINFIKSNIKHTH